MVNFSFFTGFSLRILFFTLRMSFDLIKFLLSSWHEGGGGVGRGSGRGSVLGGSGSGHPKKADSDPQQCSEGFTIPVIRILCTEFFMYENVRVVPDTDLASRISGTTLENVQF